MKSDRRTWGLGTIRYNGDKGWTEIQALVLEGGHLAVHPNPNCQPRCCCSTTCECGELGEEFVLTHCASGLRVHINSSLTYEVPLLR